MSLRSSQIQWEFLLNASRATLQSFEMSRLGHAADLRKEIVALLNQWIDENTAAGLARCLLDERDRVARTPENSPASRSFSAQSASDNILADRSRPQAKDGGEF